LFSAEHSPDFAYFAVEKFCSASPHVHVSRFISLTFCSQISRLLFPIEIRNSKIENPLCHSAFAAYYPLRPNLFTVNDLLGNTMHAGHLFSVLLILVLQFILVAVGSAINVAWVTIPYLAMVFLACGRGSVWALRDAPLGLSTSRQAVKTTIVYAVGFGLSLLFFILSVAFWGGRVQTK